MQIGEIQVELPKQPPLREMRNYGLPEKDQKFKKEKILPNFHLLDDDDPDKEAFVESMYHKRENGEWWLIKGTPIYVCGHAWFFFNFWYLQKGNLPTFRMEAVEFYQVYEHVLRDKNILGLCIIKARREGCSAKLNCAFYDDATRQQFQHVALMGDSEHRSKENYNKITLGHANMVSFFRPIHKGTTKQQKELEFTMPQQTISAKHMTTILAEMEIQGVESKINYAASTLGQYDGDQPDRFYFDECFKVDKFDPYEQLNIIRPAMEAHGGMHFIGKAFLASTVEEKGKDNFNEAVTIPYTQRLWKDSDPREVNKFGRTRSGLIRYFRDYTCPMEVDEYGYVDKKMAAEWYEEEIKAFTSVKDWSGLANFKRRKPREINDALQISSNECVLFPQKIERRLTQIREGLNDIAERESVDNIPVRGNLDWTDSKRTQVRWTVDEVNGRWLITQHPLFPNAKVMKGKLFAPKYKTIYKIACDPSDSSDDAQSKKRDLSETAICVKRSFDPDIDNADSGIIFFDQDGIEVCGNPHKLKTNRYVCVYLYRHDDPYLNYDDALKTAIYYGTPMLIEKNIRYMRNQFVQEGYEHYLTNPPEIAAPEGNKKNFLKQKGITTTAATKRTSIDILKAYYYNYCMIIDFENVLGQARNFNGKNFTDLDLMVAQGYCEIQEEDLKNMPKIQENNDNASFELYRKYKNTL